MRQCQNCGFSGCEPGDKFCIRCGKKLQDSHHSATRLGMTRRVSTPSDVYYRLGLVYYKRGKLEEAIRSWENSLQDDPSNTLAKEMIDKAKEELTVPGVKE